MRRALVVTAVALFIFANAALVVLPTRAATGASFKIICDYVRSAPDDPIVYPGQPGLSHLHDFFGSTFSGTVVSPAILKAAGTTCDEPADHAGYWTPALFVDGAQVLPDRVTAYYIRGTTATVRPYPRDFRMIAGDRMATSPQDPKVTEWACEGGGGNPPASCPSDLILRVAFPDCWNGVETDSADHKSHVTRHGQGGDCPASHPIALPKLSQEIHYPTHGGNVALASGGTHSGHADFVNGWNRDRLRQLVDECLNAEVKCR